MSFLLPKNFITQKRLPQATFSTKLTNLNLKLLNTGYNFTFNPVASASATRTSSTSALLISNYQFNSPFTRLCLMLAPEIFFLKAAGLPLLVGLEF